MPHERDSDRYDRELVQQEIRRVLLILRRTIRHQKLTQLQVQERLGWGHSSLSQLFTGQKRLRFDQLLAILQVIGVPPRRFFQELYGTNPGPQRPCPGATAQSNERGDDTVKAPKGKWLAFRTESDPGFSA